MSASSDLPRLLGGVAGASQPLTLRQHLDIHGPLRLRPGRGPDPRLVDAVGHAGLCGRGGAAFPTGAKLASVAQRRGRPVVLANGVEGEPVSGKDEILLTRVPHLVLDGAAVAAQAVAADRVIIAVTASLAGAVDAAVSERISHGVDTVEPEVVVVPDRFVAGEETALVSYVNKGKGLPAFVPPRPFERGVGGRPTLVNNAETLAHMALIARFGPDWFRVLGTPAEPGSTLVTVSGVVRRPGVYEIERGTPVAEVIELAGGHTAALQAFLIGGYAGSWVDASRAWEAPLSEDGLRPMGGTLGAGVVIAFPQEGCGLSEAARIMNYLSAQSAGQCGPCVHGLAAMAATLSDLSRGAASRDSVDRLRNWAWQVTGRGACHHPDGAARMVSSALQTFSADVAQHRSHRPCPYARTGPRSAPRAPLSSR